MIGVLYISYEGMLEPLGQSQVLAYLERLAGEWPIHLVSFEKPDDWAKVAVRKAIALRIKAAGIAWHPLRYHKRPSVAATSWDVVQGIRLGTTLVRRHGLSIVHARSYVPSVMALAIKRQTGARFIFDMRGFWADERVDAGLWPKDSGLYKLAKAFERRFLLAADAVVSLTHAGKREIERFDYLDGRVLRIAVISTCTDLSRFTPPSNRPDGAFVLGYAGTASGWYDFDEVIAVWTALRSARPDARLRIVNRNDHDLIRQKLEFHGVDPNIREIVAADFWKMPCSLRRMSAGVVIAKSGYSHLARAPTRIAEFLGCGVPMLASACVGDMAEILEGERVGVVLRSLSFESRREAVERLLSLAAEPDITDRCVSVARRYFSLEDGVEAYRRIYRSLGTGLAM